MKIELTKEDKQELETLHKGERDRRVADRIKAVLLFSEGWTQLQISQALRLRPETIHDHLEDYRRLVYRTFFFNPLELFDKSELPRGLKKLLSSFVAFLSQSLMHLRMRSNP